MFGSEALKPKTGWDFSASENGDDERNRQKYKETKKEESESACVHASIFSSFVKFVDTEK